MAKRDTQQSIQAAWEKEINRRVAELDAGSAKTVPWTEVRRRLLAKLKRKKTQVSNPTTRKPASKK
jgi:hypothetical protein